MSSLAAASSQSRATRRRRGRCIRGGALDDGAAIYVHRFNLDFLGPWPFRHENPNLWLLDSLGFPWILSSESRLINGLRGINRAKFFRRRFFRRRERRNGRRGRGHAEGQDCSWGKLSLQFLLFRNRLFVRVSHHAWSSTAGSASLSRIDSGAPSQRCDTADFMAATV